MGVNTQADDGAKPRKPQPLLRLSTLRWLAAASLCILYMSVSTGLILLNKYLMTIDGFEYPLALSSSGMAFSSAASFVACKVGSGAAAREAISALPFMQQVLKLVETKHTFSASFYMTHMMPVGFFMTLTLYFGNKVYLYLTVSFIQMLKVRVLP